MARAVRQAGDKLPARNRRFLGRVIPRGEAVIQPEPKQKPEELWVSTFTYTAEEYAVVIKGMIQQHFWRMAPLLAAVAMMAAMALLMMLNEYGIYSFEAPFGASKFFGK